MKSRTTARSHQKVSAYAGTQGTASVLIVPKRSPTNSPTERVDVRMLQLIFALPKEGGQFFVGQQVDGFVPAKAKQ